MEGVSTQDYADTITRQAIQISHLQTSREKLETENARLRHLLELRSLGSGDALQDGRPLSAPGGRHQQALSDQGADSTSDTNLYDRMSQRCAELESKNSDLQAEHAKCKPLVEAANIKWREAKRVARQWKAYYEKHKSIGAKGNASTLREPVQDPAQDSGKEQQAISGDGVPTPKGATVAKTNTAIPGHVEQNAAINSDLPSSPPPSSRPEHSRQLPLQSSTSHVPRISSSQTTADEQDGEDGTVLPAEPRSEDNESPVVVSARALKRRAGRMEAEPSARRIKQEPASQASPIEIKSEDYSSPLEAPNRIYRTQTSDLDRVGPAIVTPRRPRRLHDLLPRAKSGESFKFATSLIRTASYLSEGDVSEQRTMASSDRSGNALQSISTNVPCGTHRRASTARHKLGARRSKSRDKVMLLSEDGDDHASQVWPHSPKHSTGVSRTGKGAGDPQIEYMLNKPTQERTPIIPSKNPAPTSTIKKSRVPPLLPTPAFGVKLASPTKSKSPARPQLFPAPQEPAPPLQPEDEPLRCRPKETLRREDFKVNPQYLGSTFAFADTLRGRDQRRNLHTCSRPDCCGGALQKAISMGGSKLSGKTDTEALEAYLGPSWEHHLGAYGPEKRKELVTQAHAHCFSNQHGKHRSAFNRHNTPPGYWDTDFPTTQEISDNRAKAQEMERQTVEDRWRDAIRGGGRWLFRDE